MSSSSSCCLSIRLLLCSGCQSARDFADPLHGLTCRGLQERQKETMDEKEAEDKRVHASRQTRFHARRDMYQRRKCITGVIFHKRLIQRLHEAHEGPVSARRLLFANEGGMASRSMSFPCVRIQSASQTRQTHTHTSKDQAKQTRQTTRSWEKKKKKESVRLIQKRFPCQKSLLRKEQREKDHLTYGK